MKPTHPVFKAWAIDMIIDPPEQKPNGSLEFFYLCYNNFIKLCRYIQLITIHLSNESEINAFISQTHDATWLHQINCIDYRNKNLINHFSPSMIVYTLNTYLKQARQIMGHYR